MEGQTKSTPMSLHTRAELGIISGFVASIVMMLVIMILTYVGWLQVPWFSLVGAIFTPTTSATPVTLSTPNPSLYLAISGLAWFLAIGIIGGLFFAFASRHQSVTEGLAVAGLMLLILAIVLSVVTVPQLSGTLWSMSISGAFSLLAPLAISFAAWGITAGYIGERYLD